MKTLSVVYFCATLDEVSSILEPASLFGISVNARKGEVSPCLVSAFFTDPAVSETSLIVARKPTDIVFAAPNGIMERLRRIFGRASEKAGASLQASRNAVMLNLPVIDAGKRRVTPGSAVSFSGNGELFRWFSSRLEDVFQKRDGFLVSPEVTRLLDNGSSIWVG